MVHDGVLVILNLVKQHLVSYGVVVLEGGGGRGREGGRGGIREEGALGRGREGEGGIREGEGGRGRH